MVKKVTIIRERIFGKNAYVIKLGNEKKFFDFTKKGAEAKAARLRKNPKLRLRPKGN